MAIVYLLTNIENGKLYVGKTKSTLQQRWHQHLREVQKGCGYAIHAAIRKYGKSSFTKRVLSEYDTEEAALVGEREWIVKLGSMTPSGYNMTEGGRGAIGFKHTPEEIARRSDRMKATAADPAWREMMSERAKAQWADPEIAAKNRAAIEAARTPEVWGRIAASQAAVRGSPEHRALMSQRAKERWARPEHRAKIAATIAGKTPEERRAQSAAARLASTTPEVAHKRSAAAKARWADPEFRARTGSAISVSRTPEFNAAAAERSRAALADPEMRARLSAAQKTPEAQARHAAMRARPCKHCGDPRVRLDNGQMRCQRCHAAKENARRKAETPPADTATFALCPAAEPRSRETSPPTPSSRPPSSRTRSA